MRGIESILLQKNNSLQVESIRLKRRLEIYFRVFEERLVSKSRIFNIHRSCWQYLKVGIIERYDEQTVIRKEGNLACK